MYEIRAYKAGANGKTRIAMIKKSGKWFGFHRLDAVVVHPQEVAAKTRRQLPANSRRLLASNHSLAELRRFPPSRSHYNRDRSFTKRN
jgi:hypothetical protein